MDADLGRQLRAIATRGLLTSDHGRALLREQLRREEGLTPSLTPRLTPNTPDRDERDAHEANE